MLNNKLSTVALHSNCPQARVGTGSTHTRACSTCSIAKVKCMYSNRSRGSKCDRCSRLKKDCVLPPVIARRPRKKRNTRVAQLEEKLDGLVNLLASKKPTLENSTVPNGIYETTFVGSTQAVHQAPASKSDGLPISADGCRSTVSSHFDSIDDLAAQHSLELFRTRIAPNFPFVVLQSSYNVGKLRSERPAFFRSIMMASSYNDAERSMMMGEELLSYLMDHLVFRGEKSLDLLQSLLLYIAWYHSVFHIKRRVTSLLQIGNALVTDLGYTLAPRAAERYLASLEWTRATHGANAIAQPGVRTLAERRAYVGMFYLSSSVTCYHKELHSLRPIEYLEECCTTLQNAREYPEDEFLVNLVRLQAICERIAQKFSGQDPEAYFGRGVPLNLYLQPFQKELETLKAAIPKDLIQKNLLLLHYHSAEIYLYEVAIFPQIFNSGDSSVQRIEALYACLYAIKAFHEVLDAIPLGEYFNVANLTWMQVTHSIVDLAKLSLLEIENWNIDYVRRILNLSDLLGKLSSRFKDVRSIAGLDRDLTDEDPDMFSRFSRRLQNIKEKYDTKINASRGQTDSGISNDAATLAIDDCLPAEMVLDIDDESFWNDFLGDWEQTFFER